MSTEEKIRKARTLNLRTLKKRARDFVLKQGYPRLKVTVILAATLFTGFSCSALLLRFGLANMGLRYGISALVAYAAFFLYMRALVYWFFRRSDDQTSLVERIEDELDTVDAAGDVLDTAADVVDAKSETSGASGIGDIFGDSEFVVVLIALAMILGVFFASFYVIYIAPELLFEVVMDAFIGLGVFKMLRNDRRKHWAESTLRATIWPFVATFVLVTGGGFAIQLLVPAAVKMKDIFH